MSTKKLITIGSLLTFVTSIAIFFYIINISNALSYLSSDPKVCINCHVMNTQYATWQHSSHARVAGCVDCHLPTDNLLDKYIAKARDGLRHATIFTTNSYKHSIFITKDAEERVLQNCINCHKSLVTSLTSNSNMQHGYDESGLQSERKCWDCHREVPHGRVRGLATTPNNLGVLEAE